MIHVYAMLAAGAAVPVIEGVDDAPVAALQVGDLSAAVSLLDDAPEPTQSNLLRHAAVVDALAEQNDAVLPARFTSRFATAGALEAAVGRQERRLADALAAVAGCVELSVRVLRPADETQETVAPSGSDYLRRKLAEHGELDELGTALRAPLRGLARSTRLRAGGTSGGLLLDDRYLVAAEAVAAFSEEVVRLQQGHRELGVVCTGPWPPYNFVQPPEEGS